MSTRVLNIAALPQIKSGAGDSPNLDGAPILALQNPPPISAPSGQFGLPLLVGDQLAIEAFSNAGSRTVTATLRLVNAAGNITAVTQQWSYDNAYTKQTFTMDLPQPGFLQCLTLTWDPDPVRPQWMYCTAGVVNAASDGEAYLQLIGDYINRSSTATWPSRGVKPPLEGPGLSYTFLGDSPAAGVQALNQVPNYVRWTLHWVGFEFIASGASGDRTMQLQALLGVDDNLMWTATLVPAVAPGTDMQAEYDSYGGDLQNGAVVYRSPLPRPFYLHASDKLITNIGGLDAGDQIFQMHLGITEHYTPDFEGGD